MLPIYSCNIELACIVEFNSYHISGAETEAENPPLYTLSGLSLMDKNPDAFVLMLWYEHSSNVPQLYSCGSTVVLHREQQSLRDGEGREVLVTHHMSVLFYPPGSGGSLLLLHRKDNNPLRW